MVRSLVSRRVESVIAHNRVTVGIVVSPSHGVADVNRQGERKKAILIGNRHSANRRIVARSARPDHTQWDERRNDEEDRYELPHDVPPLVVGTFETFD